MVMSGICHDDVMKTHLNHVPCAKGLDVIPLLVEETVSLHTPGGGHALHIALHSTSH